MAGGSAGGVVGWLTGGVVWPAGGVVWPAGGVVWPAGGVVGWLTGGVVWPAGGVVPGSAGASFAPHVSHRAANDVGATLPTMSVATTPAITGAMARWATRSVVIAVVTAAGLVLSVVRMRCR